MFALATKIKQNKTWFYSGVLSLILVIVFVAARPVFAIGEGVVLSLLNILITPFIHFLGNVLLVFIEILINIFQFSDFINAPAVQLGFVVIRDLANIGIVVALMIIAFSTVFGIQKYAASQLLIRLIIAAFMVNFSLLIAGLIIDAGQVIMMTFVHAFDKIAAGNLVNGLGIENMLNIAETLEDNSAFGYGDFLPLIGAMLLALVLLIVSIGVILVFIVVILQRIMYLWILAIFAPLPWVAPLLPNGGSIGSKWWSNFTTQVFIGPLLAFGFWLSMSILAGVAADQSLINLSITSTATLTATDSAKMARFVSEVSTPQAIFDFMVTIALLMGTLSMAKSAGAVAGSFAGNVSGKFTKTAAGIMNGVRRKVGITGLAAGIATGGVLPVLGAIGGRSVGRRLLASKRAEKILRRVPGGKLATAAARDRQKKASLASQTRYRKGMEKLGLGEETGAQIGRLPQKGFGGAIFGNLSRAGEAMSKAKVQARKFSEKYNSAETESERREMLASFIKTSNYSHTTGATDFYKNVMGSLNRDTIGADIAHINANKADYQVKESHFKDFQRATASYQESGGSAAAPKFGEVKSALNTVSDGGGGTGKSIDELAAGNIAHSRTNMDDLAVHEKFKEHIEDIKKTTGKKEEEVLEEYFKNDNEQYQAALKDGYAEIGHDTASAPAVEAMKEKYIQTEHVVNEIAKSSQDGVTVGNARSNLFTVGYKEINETLSKLGHSPLMTEDDQGSEGDRVAGDQALAVRDGLVSMMKTQIEKLEDTDATYKAKRESLISFGKGNQVQDLDVTNAEDQKKIDEMIPQVIAKANKSISYMADDSRIKKEGIKLIDKNRLAGSGLGIAKHEDFHEYASLSDPDKTIRNKLVDKVKEAGWMGQVDQHLKGRGDFDKMSEMERVEEYAADVMARKIVDDEFRLALSEVGLTKKQAKERIKKMQSVTGVNESGEVVYKKEV